MDKIYSRNKRIHLPKFNKNNFQKIYNRVNTPFDNEGKNRKRKFSKISFIIIISILTVKMVIQAISPILDKQCINIAKSIATKISNQQASAVMSKYKYDDLCIIDKDTNREYKND